jgi:hypothetical protein
VIYILPLTAYTIIVWLIGSYIAWDIDWFLHIGDWHAFERFGFMVFNLIGSVTFIAIPCILKEESKLND